MRVFVAHDTYEDETLTCMRGTLSVVASGPRLGNTRRTERAGVRAVTDFFESNDCVVQPINGENDFGKDLYVDLTQAEVITGTTGAIQVKSGPSYRTANGYQIPIDQHLHCWRDSTVPVIGVVCDEERALMVWTNLTQHLRTRTDDLKHVPVPSSSILDRAALPMLEASIRETGVGTHPLVELWSTNAIDVREAVWDCLALGRRGPRRGGDGIDRSRQAGLVDPHAVMIPGPRPCAAANGGPRARPAWCAARCAVEPRPPAASMSSGAGLNHRRRQAHPPRSDSRETGTRLPSRRWPACDPRTAPPEPAR